MYEFIKIMFALHCPIEGYVVYKAITPEQYKEITGKDYVATTQA